MSDDLAPDIKDIPVGSMLPFGASGDIPDHWVKCDGTSVEREENPEFVNLMNAVFNDQEYELDEDLEAQTRKIMDTYGMKVDFDRVKLPDFTGHEAELAFGSNISGIVVVIAMKVERDSE